VGILWKGNAHRFCDLGVTRQKWLSWDFGWGLHRDWECRYITYCCSRGLEDGQLEVFSGVCFVGWMEGLMVERKRGEREGMVGRL